MSGGITFFDDGKIGLSIERHGATMRLFDRPAHTGKPAYITAGHVHRWSRTNAMLGGFHGVLSIRHQALIAKALHYEGFQFLYVERSDNIELTRTPMFVPCPYAPLEAFMVCDLDAAVLRANLRYPATYVRSGNAHPSI